MLWWTDPDSYKLGEKCWRVIFDLLVKILTKYFGVPERVAWALVLSTTMVYNRLMYDHPFDFHSSRRNQQAYDAETARTDPIMRGLLEALLPKLSKQVLVFVFGKALFDSCLGWIPNDMLITFLRVRCLSDLLRLNINI